MARLGRSPLLARKAPGMSQILGRLTKEFGSAAFGRVARRKSPRKPVDLRTVDRSGHVHGIDYVGLCRRWSRYVAAFLSRRNFVRISASLWANSRS